MTKTTESILRPNAAPNVMDIKLDTTYMGSYFQMRGVTEDTFRRFNLGKVVEAPRSLPKDIINSPAMPLYDVDGVLQGWIFRPDNPAYKYFYYLVKTSEHLYGFPFAIESILQKNEAILVEGPFDALLAHSYGYTNVLAVMGAYLSIPQVVLLATYTNRLKLAFDSDRAGLAGMVASEKTAYKIYPGFSIDRFMVYPYKDFCDYITTETINDR